MAAPSKKRRRGSPRRTKSDGGGGRGSRAVSDLGPYVGFGIVWLFVSFIAYLTVPDIAPLIATVLITLLFVYAAWCTWAAYSGRSLRPWQKGLVRLPLVLLGARRVPVNDIADAPLGRNAGIVATVIALLFVSLCLVIAMRGA